MIKQAITFILFLFLTNTDGFFLRKLFIGTKPKLDPIGIKHSKGPRIFDPKLDLIVGDGGSLGHGGGGGGGYNDITSDSSDDDGGPIATASFDILGFFKSLSDLYTEKLLVNPYTTKIITAALVGTFSDFLYQVLGKADGKIDMRRLAVFMLVSGVYVAPFIHIWFNALSGFTNPLVSGSVPRALIMVGLDQTIGAFFMNIGFFFAYELVQNLVMPNSIDDESIPVFEKGVTSVKKNLKNTIVAGWHYWPFVNFSIFLLVPLHFRVLASNSAMIFWNMYLSMVTNG